MITVERFKGGDTLQKYSRLIFVCTGNTCRSPMAEIIFRSLDTDSEIEILSRGIVVLFSEPSNPKAEMVLQNHNLVLKDHVSKPLRQTDITDSTLLLTMTENQKKQVMQNFNVTDNLYTIKEYVGEFGDVTDPYGGTLMDYESCYVELARLVKKTVYRLNEESVDEG